MLLNNTSNMKNIFFKKIRCLVTFRKHLQKVEKLIMVDELGKSTLKKAIQLKIY